LLDLTYLKSKTRPSLWILVFMVAVGPFGDTEYIPSLPQIVSHYNISYSLGQHTMTAYLAGYALFQLFYGCMSDRYGRRPLMISGAITFVFGSLICCFSPNIQVLLIGRFIQGLGSCAGTIISMASVKDSYPVAEHGRTFAKINAAFAIAPGVGPLVGQYVYLHFPWQVNFMILFVLSFLMLVCVFFFFPETNLSLNYTATHLKNIVANYKKLFRDPYYYSYLALLGLSIGIVYACLTEAPALVIFILNIKTYGVIIIAMGVMFGFIIGSIACTYLLKYFHYNTIILTGLLIMLTTSLVMWSFVWLDKVNLITTLAPIVLIFTGIALVNPTSTASAILPFETIAGTASAMLGFSQMGLAALSTVLISILRDNTAHAMPKTFTILSSIALLIFILAIYRRRGLQREVV
jgi:DHA1 family bicyclomycin/chloramphenicol resistance-like MFS transporter